MDVCQMREVFEKNSTAEDKEYIRKEDVDKVLDACGLKGDKKKALRAAIMEWDEDDPLVHFKEFKRHMTTGRLRKAFDKVCKPGDEDHVSKDQLYEVLGECGLTEENRKASYDELVADDPDDPLVHFDRVLDMI